MTPAIAEGYLNAIDAIFMMACSFVALGTVARWFGIGLR